MLITKEEEKLEQEALAAMENIPWRCDSRMYGRTNMNPPFAGVSRGGGIKPVHQQRILRSNQENGKAVATLTFQGGSH